MTLRTRPFGPAAWAAAPLAVAILAAGTLPASAKEEPTVGPVQRHLAGLEIGPGFEHRLVIVHPISVWVPQPAPPADVRAACGDVVGDSLALGRVEPGLHPTVDALALTDPPVLFSVGDVIRSATA